MTLTIHLLGRPRAERSESDTYQLRSRKSWAVLAYLVLSERPPTRGLLASLLFAEADDPLRALRWSLTEVRRLLDDDGSLDGDPVRLVLSGDVLVDVAAIAHGVWTHAADLPGLGADLLEGVAVRGAAGFEAWLLSERRRLALASEAVLHEAALGWMSRGALGIARGYAVRAAAMNPLDDSRQALLIRLYRLAGDDRAAEAQYASCARLLDEELGVAPGPAVEAAMRERPPRPQTLTDVAEVRALAEAGSAAVAAGAVEAGVGSLRTAVRLADGGAAAGLRVTSRLALAEALIHSTGPPDEEGLLILHEADRIALADDDAQAVARARAELGYVDFLRGRYDRAHLWLTEASEFAGTSPGVLAKTTIFLGAVESDRASYGAAVALLQEGTRLSRAAGDPRREAYGLSMLGRVGLLRGDLDAAADQVAAALHLAEADHWLSFLPWPQSLQGEILLARGDTSGASEALSQAFARACQLRDPCWEGMSARGLAMVAEATGETGRAFELLYDARARCNRVADPYRWLDVYILDAQSTLGRRHGHPETRAWVETMRERASRHAMKELVVRSMLHAAALGSRGDAAAAALLGAEIDNPVLDALLVAHAAASAGP
jgi:DNA-binding SARP family transcriptional activator